MYMSLHVSVFLVFFLSFFIMLVCLFYLPLCFLKREKENMELSGYGGGEEMREGKL